MQLQLACIPVGGVCCKTATHAPFPHPPFVWCSKPGTYAPDNQCTKCKLCPKGFQCPTNAMSKEAPCPRGTFSNREGLRLCTPW